MDPFQFTTRYFWAVCLVVVGIQFLLSGRRAGLLSTDPSTRSQIDFYRRVWFAAHAFPFVIMGWGIEAGGLVSIWDICRPQDGNPYVLAFAGGPFIFACGFACWIFTGGARIAIALKLPQVLGMRNAPITERGMKLIALVSILAVPAWLMLCLLAGTPDHPAGPLLRHAQTISPDGYKIVFDVVREGYTN